MSEVFLQDHIEFSRFLVASPDYAKFLHTVIARELETLDTILAQRLIDATLADNEKPEHPTSADPDNDSGHDQQ